MLQEHHHMSQNGMQRNARMGMQQMGPPPNQRTPMLMSMPAPGVLVSMSPGPGPTLITTTSIPQQPQPKPTMQQVYHYESAGPPDTDPHSTDHQNCSNTNTLSTPNATLANIKEKTPMCLVNELEITNDPFKIPFSHIFQNCTFNPFYPRTRYAGTNSVFGEFYPRTNPAFDFLVFNELYPGNNPTQSYNPRKFPKRNLEGLFLAPSLPFGPFIQTYVFNDFYPTTSAFNNFYPSTNPTQTHVLSRIGNVNVEETYDAPSVSTYQNFSYQEFVPGANSTLINEFSPINNEENHNAFFKKPSSPSSQRVFKEFIPRANSSFVNEFYPSTDTNNTRVPRKITKKNHDDSLDIYKIPTDFKTKCSSSNQIDSYSSLNARKNFKRIALESTNAVKLPRYPYFRKKNAFIHVPDEDEINPTFGPRKITKQFQNARYNKIQHQYRLTGEQGPAHKKIFTVTLKLGNEEYEAEGASIKKAQHSAAAQALAKTEFKHPPPKTVRNRPGTRPTNPGVVTPTVELNALAMKRGERTVYVIENGGAPPHQGYLAQPGYYPRHNLYNAQTQPQRYGYDARRNIRGGHYPYHENRYYNQFRPGTPHNPGDPYTVRLRVGEREYPGQGYTVQAARHDAAAKAIEHIKQLGDTDLSDGSMSPDSSQHMVNESMQQVTNVNDINSDLKSPISLVYEIALKRNLSVIFEVLSEKGPPHMKVFITQCRVGSFLAEGEGNGKKISKKRAAEKMLEELSKLPPLPNIINIAQLKRKRVTNKKKTRNLIKVNTDKSTEVAEEINPISRLIQIQQANKEREPVYTVLEERGAPRRREFVIEASVNGHCCTGVGPNKKVAKRNAAEALLIELGYNNSPIANKPLNKDKEEQSVMHSNTDKNRKVTFVEEAQENQPTQSVGGSGGRQLVPGILLVTEQAGFPKQKDNMDKPMQSQQTQIKPPSTIQGVRSKDKLLYLAQLMNIQVQFSDFPKANHEMYLTLVSLSTNPPQVCHGEGPTTEASHEKAALEALKVLSELGLDIAPKDGPTGPSGDGTSPVMSNKGPVHQNGVKK